MGRYHNYDDPQTLKARSRRGKFTLDRTQWYGRIDHAPDYLFDELCAQQSSYVGAINDLQLKIGDYRADMHKRLEHEQQEETYKEKFGNLQERLSIMQQQELDHKRHNQDLEAKLLAQEKKEQGYKKQIGDLETRLSVLRRQEHVHKLQTADYDVKIAGNKHEERKYKARIAALEVRLETHARQEKEYKTRMANIAERSAAQAQPQKDLEDRIAELESRLVTSATVQDINTLRGIGCVKAISSSTDSSSATMPLADPPKLVDGVDPKFANWRYLMELRFSANSDHFDTSICRLAYLASRMSGEAHDQLVARMRSKILKPIADVEEALGYLDMVYHEPELRTTDPADFCLPRRDRNEFWRFFRAFIWNAVKFEIPEEDWNQKLHEYLWFVLKKDIGEYSCYSEGTPKELAKGILLYLMKQEWDDAISSETIEHAEEAESLTRDA
ncbi:hypothetical protein BJX70DRAFT_393307 [Aspergillus crustosus]